MSAGAVRLAALEEAVKTILSPAGLAGDLAASALIEAEVVGQPEFGLRLLRELDKGARLEPGRIVANTPAMVTLDASGCFGPVAVAGATHLAINRARDMGLSLVGLQCVGSVGRLATYVAAMAGVGYFGLAITHSPPLVAPASGRDPVLGTNPMAYAAPSPAGPIVADFATSAITKAQLDRARATGTSLPPASALDSHGAPTTDPARVHALLLFDGVKSFLVSLFIELFAGALLATRGHPTGRGLLLLVIKPEALSTRQVMAQVEALAEAIRAAGGRVPGDGTAACWQAVRAKGEIEVEATMVKWLERLVPQIELR